MSQARAAAAPVTVAVDAMGGDNAPQAVVAGALQAAAEGIAVLLVGKPSELSALVPEGAAGVEIVEAPDVIGAGDEPVSTVRAHPQSSMVVTARLVAEGRADAAFSAGNTGAFVAASLLTVRRMRGVKRPAICAVLPAVPRPVVLLDAGANAEVRPEHLRQFAHMGQAFAREVLGVARPTVALLSIGEEPGKGTLLVIETHRLLAADPGLDFFGNVEGRDLLMHKADVVVTDGFTGNVALKTAEGAARAIMGSLKSAVTAGTRGRLGALLLRSDLRALRDRLDPEAYGGQHLLGMSRPVVIGHGSTGARGAANAVRYAARAASGGLLAAIEQQLAAAAPLERQGPSTGPSGRVPPN